MKRVVGGAVGAAFDEARAERRLSQQLRQLGHVGGTVIFETELRGGV